MSRTDQRPIGRREEQAAAAVQQVHAGFVHIRSADGFAPADANVVGALRALATAAPIHEQIIMVVMSAQIGGFDGLVVSEGKQLRVWRRSLAGSRVELKQLDAAPI